MRRAFCAYLGSACADLQVCATELITNVIRHLGEGVPVTVRASCDQGRTRLEATDPDPRAPPVLCRSADDEETGRGLTLLDALALRWGVEQGPGTKTVRCELPGGDRESLRGHSGRFRRYVRRRDRKVNAAVQSARRAGSVVVTKE